MRWDNLITDLSGQLEHELRREARGQVAELTRAELASIELRDKLHAHLGQQLKVSVAGSGQHEGTLVDLGADWLLLQTSHNHQHTVVRLEAVAAVSGIGKKAMTGTKPLALNLPFNTVLRSLAQDRAWTQISTSTAQIRARFEAIGNAWCEVTNSETRTRVLLNTSHILAISSLAHQLM